jgi:hypothetical protein
MKMRKPRRPPGRWIYYILHEDMLWPCPVKWEWESGYNAWLPFYYSPRWNSSPATPPAPPRSAAVAVKRAARLAARHSLT